MKSKLKKLTAVMLSIVMIFGVISAVPFTVNAAGNSMSTATNYTLGSTVYGNITSSNSNDFYKFTVPTSGRIKLDVNAGIEWAYYHIFDANGNTLFDVNRKWNTTTEIMTMSETVDLTSGTYYFNIEKDGSRTGSYSFKISFTSANESFKESQFTSDNNFAKANSISLNTTYKGQIAVNDDKDFYKFTLPTSGRVKLDVNAGLKWAYYHIYDANGNTMFDVNRNWNATTEIMTMSETVDLTSGTYYFNVEKDGSNTGSYSFKLSFTSANESFKESLVSSNNNFSTASLISLNATYKGQIAVNDDKDFYKFTITAPGKIQLNVNAGIEWTYFHFYDVNGNTLFDFDKRWNDNTKTMTMSETMYFKPGTYYFNVERDGKYTGTYSFKLSSARIPANVSGFKATSSANAVKLTWNKASGAKGYIVYSYNFSTKKYKRIAKTTKTTFTNSKLKSGTTYRYAVRAYSTFDGKEILSKSYPQVTISTNPATVNFSLKTGSKKVAVKWNKVTGATGYKVYYKTSSNSKWTLLKTTKGTSYTKSGLAKGKKYYFTVKAYRTVNNKTYNGSYKAKSITVK